jgi:hypothetical protein
VPGASGHGNALALKLRRIGTDNSSEKMSMHLAETSAFTSSTSTSHEAPAATTDYARALRAIGQDLTGLFPRILEIQTDGTSFEARGQSHANPFRQTREPSFKRLWKKLFGKDATSELIALEKAQLTFARTYSPEDIERLDQLYSANRSSHVKRPDNYSLAERLRTMGSIVKSRKGRLKQLRKDADHLFVDYWDPQGKLQTAKLTTVILYRNQQAQISPDGEPEELWEGYDF